MLSIDDKIEVLKLFYYILQRCEPTRVHNPNNTFFEESVNQNNFVYEIENEIIDLVNRELRFSGGNSAE